MHLLRLMFSQILFAGCLLAMHASACTQSAHAEAGGVRATDLFLMRTVESIDVAADGRFAVLVIRSIERPDASAFEGTVRSHIYIAELTRSQPELRALTFGARRDRAAQISPDGRTLAFLRAETGEETAQVHLLPMEGGEARSLTRLEHGVAGFIWGPDGRTILAWSDEPLLPGTIDGDVPPWPQERPGWSEAGGDVAADPDGSPPEVRAWLEGNERRGNPVCITRLDFQDEQRLRVGEKVRRLHLVDVVRSGGAAASRRIGAAWRSHQSPVFSIDGSAIFYVALRDESVHPDRTLDACIRSITLDTGVDDVVLGEPGWQFDTLRPSRDGTVLAFRAQRTSEPNYRPWKLGVCSIVNGRLSAPIWMTDEQTLDLSVRAVEWLPGRSRLLFTVPRRGSFPLMTMGVGLIEPASLVDQINEQPAGVHAFAAGASTIVYAATTAAHPCVVRVQDVRGDRMIADLNPWTSQRRLSRPEARTITRPDGLQVDYWYMPPIGHESMASYPAVLQIHGGPSAMWGPGEMTMWHEFQYFCARGYAVVYANPRGSGGYGTAFQRANHADWSEGPAGDVLAALDHAIARGSIDARRLFVTGGSYGGYLTAYIITRDHRFRAAVAQRGVYELTTFFGEGNAWRLVPRAMGGMPFEAQTRMVLRRESPFTHVQRIRTPLLIMHASEDLRTGVSQSEMMYRALKVLGAEVEYVRYPGAGHDLSRSGKPAQRLDRLVRIASFFDRHDAP